MEKPETSSGEKPDNPDKEHFDKMLLKELVWKLDREVWAHVPNPEPSEEWTTSKAREESRKLISEYIGDFDALHSEFARQENLLHINLRIIRKIEEYQAQFDESDPQYLAIEGLISFIHGSKK